MPRNLIVLEVKATNIDTGETAVFKVRRNESDAHGVQYAVYCVDGCLGDGSDIVWSSNPHIAMTRCADEARAHVVGM